MNKMKMIFLFALFGFFFLVIPDVGFAEENGRYCSGIKVLSAGARLNEKIICVIHSRTDCGDNWPPNTPRWFSLNNADPTISNAMLAAAFTSQTYGIPLVLVPKNGSFVPWAVMQQVYTLSN